jgi:hypothetical protein
VPRKPPLDLWSEARQVQGGNEDKLGKLCRYGTEYRTERKKDAAVELRRIVPYVR